MLVGACELRSFLGETVPAMHTGLPPPGRVPFQDVSPSRTCHGRTAEGLEGKQQSQGKMGMEGLAGGAHCVFYLVVWCLVGSC